MKTIKFINKEMRDEAYEKCNKLYTSIVNALNEIIVKVPTITLETLESTGMPTQDKHAFAVDWTRKFIDALDKVSPRHKRACEHVIESNAEDTVNGYAGAYMALNSIHERLSSIWESVETLAEDYSATLNDLKNTRRYKL